jgi:hypothetical protein
MFARDLAFGTFARSASLALRPQCNVGRHLGIRSGLEDDRETQTLQTPDQPFFGALGVQAVKVVPAHFAILGSIPQHAEGDHEDSVRQRNDGLAHPMLASLAVEKGGQIAVFLARRGPGGLTQCPSQPAISLARPVA